MHQPPLPFWGISASEVLQELHTAEDGLIADDATQRLARYGSNLLTPKKRSDPVTLLLAQFKSPITLILLCATGLSFALRDPVDAFILLGPYILLPKSSTALVASVTITMVALAVFGYVQGHFTGRPRSGVPSKRCSSAGWPLERPS